jgi:tetraacyldisaccharide 4'-kinase
MSLTGSVLKKLDDSSESSLADWRGRAVDAIAGIGNPGRFFQQLRDAGLDVNEKPFPDHHAYCADDFDSGSGRPLIMTEKDAVKCTDFGLVDAWYLPVHAEISEEFKNEFVNKVDKMLQSGNPDQTA